MPAPDAQRQAALAAQQLQAYMMLALTAGIGIFYWLHKQGSVALPQFSAVQMIGFVGTVLWVLPMICKRLVGSPTPATGNSKDQ